MKNSLYIICLCLFVFSTSVSAKMNNKKLDQLVRSIASDVKHEGSFWEFTIRDRKLLLLTDEKHDRMRIISPIKTVDKLSKTMLDNALEANFHSALDARYAISDGMMWSAFIHPLSPLTTDQFKNAVIQVYNAAATFGTLYSSSNLSFPAGE